MIWCVLKIGGFILWKPSSKQNGFTTDEYAAPWRMIAIEDWQKWIDNNKKEAKHNTYTTNDVNERGEVNKKQTKIDSISRISIAKTKKKKNNQILVFKVAIILVAEAHHSHQLTIDKIWYYYYTAVNFIFSSSSMESIRMLRISKNLCNFHALSLDLKESAFLVQIGICFIHSI